MTAAEIGRGDGLLVTGAAVRAIKMRSCWVNSLRALIVLVLLAASCVIAGAAATGAAALPVHAAAPVVGSQTTSNELLAWGSSPPTATRPEYQTVPLATGGELPAGAHVDQITDSCLLASGVPYCWGEQTLGSTTPIPAEGFPFPVAVDMTGVLKGRVVTQIAAGSSHACALADDALFCWGNNMYGDLGDGQVGGSSATPVAVHMGPLTGHHLTSLVAGTDHTCVLADGVPYCWGDDDSGQLGDGKTDPEPTPVPVDVTGALDGLTIHSLEAAGVGTCAQAGFWGYCWGASPATTGSGTITNVPTALQDGGTDSAFWIQNLAMSSTNICIVIGFSDGIYCLGQGGAGYQLGIYHPGYSYHFQRVDVPAGLYGRPISELSTGARHSCVITGGTVWCWGDNDDGELGIGTLSFGSTPVPVDVTGALAGHSVSQVYAGDGISGGQTWAISDQPPGQIVDAGAYHPLVTTRIADTRSGLNVPRHAVAAGRTVRVPIAGQAGVPRAVGSVVVNVTAVTPTARGSLVVYPTGTTPPPIGLVDFWTHDIVSSLDYLPLGSDGSITIKNASTGAAHVLVDVLGYTIAGSPHVPGSMKFVPQSRILDTRQGHHALASYQTKTLKVVGGHGIPASGVSAVAVRFEALDGQTGGAVYVDPNGVEVAGDQIGTNDEVSYGAGHPRSDVTIVPVGPSGSILLNNDSKGVVDVTVDVLGYVLAGQPTASGTYRPTYVQDYESSQTHPNYAPIPPRGKEPLPTPNLDPRHARIATDLGCLATADTVTAAAIPAYGYLSVIPATQTQVSTSLVNFKPHQWITHSVVAVAGDQLVNTSSTTANVDVTINGCFQY